MQIPDGDAKDAVSVVDRIGKAMRDARAVLDHPDATPLAQGREVPEHLLELTAFDMVPGLSEVVAAFPPALDDVERFHRHLTPVEELRGLSPLRWLLMGGDGGAGTRVAPAA